MIHATLHQLEVFETVARLQSFTKAAEELSIKQPTVSSQIKQLTQTVGLPLFEQIGKQLYLTNAGEELLNTCHDIFARLNNFEMTVADLKGVKEGKLCLTVVTTGKYFIPRLLGSFCQLYPHIDVSLQVTNHQQIHERMLENKDDLYILSKPPEDVDLERHIFLDNPLVVVAPRNHILSNKKNISLKELESFPFILREVGSNTRNVIQQIFDDHKLNIRVRLELGSNEAIKQAIIGGLGLSVLSKHTLTSSCYDELSILDVKNFPVQESWYVTYLSGKKLSVVARTFLEYLLKESINYTADKQLTLAHNHG
ncbi:LysR family transcriptional regulator [Cyanobacterium stanieri LEGE 03274]|uniref:LysR family transcriptional regulator n=1 Tax=Cyanobacterium stanieri LEGE 03274 TaxID=1828756 RepID=A0ABR9V2Q8_9CHRO|nr:LysR family transcriptional regulator [Cyanobacterium stanieri]MBE9221844.1 LysR family transcriptional regulator [Cyanobacterium stanieri LEGE 03274]